MRLISCAWLGVVACSWLACGGGTFDADSTDSSGTSSGSSGASSSGTSSGSSGASSSGIAPPDGRQLSHAEVLALCGDSTPFFSEPCALAIRDYCEPRESEAGCNSYEKGVVFNGVNVRFGCAWAKSVRFSNLDTCEVEAVTGRCIGVYGARTGCSGSCRNVDPLGSSRTLVGYPAGREMLELPCEGEELSGPVDESSVRANQQGKEPKFVTCYDTQSAVSGICGCGAAACMQ